MSPSTAKEAKRIAVIGCGARASTYLDQMKSTWRRPWRLAALADPDPRALESWRGRGYADAPVPTFADGPQLLRDMGDELDAVIIASPNHTHVDALLPALERKLTILLEKPVATSIADCGRIWRAYLEAGRPPVVVGFVLRYTAFYNEIKRQISRGDVG